MAEHFDVLVAGGGPAGATLALGLARQGWRVGLLEAASYDSPRYGETLPPEINPVLRGLGLWEQFQALGSLEASGMISVWGDPIPAEIDFVHNVHGPGWHIDRARFDRLLIDEAANAGVQVYSGCRAEACRHDGDLWSVVGCRARILVDACGANGLLIDGNINREIEDVLLGVALTISYPGEHPRDLRTCIETTPRGWWYTALLPGGLAMAIFFTDPVVYRQDGISIYEELQASPLTAKRLAHGKIRHSRVLRVTSSCRTTLFGNGWMAVGDSASSYDPLSGRGIFKALRHSSSAAKAIDAWLHGQTELISAYARQVRKEFEHYVRQRRHYYESERRWAAHPFWQSRLKHQEDDSD